jgi:hypothetical protein
MGFCSRCGNSLSATGTCSNACHERYSTRPAPDADMDALLAEARPTPIHPLETKSVTTMPAPEDGGAVIDAYETELDLTDISCWNCSQDYEEGAQFCAECGRPRGGSRTQTEPYMAAKKKGSFSSAPVPKFEPPQILKDPSARQRPIATSSYSIIRRDRNSTQPPPRTLKEKRVIANISHHKGRKK